MDATAAALLKSLNNQREHVLGILDGLGEQDLGRPVLPTGWTCAGLVHHLALDVERFWFQAVIAGTPSPAGTGEEGASAWQVPPGMTGAGALSLYRSEIGRADEIIAATPLDAAPAWWPDYFGTFRLADLRAVLLHVITETACHAGHLDAARELIDGRTWLIL